ASLSFTWDSKRMANRVAGSFSPPAPTPPGVREEMRGQISTCDRFYEVTEKDGEQSNWCKNIHLPGLLDP
ncbi:MAG: hypothetical protein AAB275_08990, partial [Deltaproteobacteria bacterium]